MALARLVDELEQPLARQRLAAAQHPGQPAIVEAGAVGHAAFAAELEYGAAAVQRDVPFAQGRETKALVGALVFPVADAHQCEFEQSRRRGQHLFTL